MATILLSELLQIIVSAEKLWRAWLKWIEMSCPQLPSARCYHPRKCQQKRLCSDFKKQTSKKCFSGTEMPTGWTLGSLRLSISNGFVGLPCWWRFIYRSFSIREGVCSFEGCSSQQDMWSPPWRACSAIGIICYLEGLLARRGITHCILLALLPSTPDGDEYGNTRRTVSIWCLASQDRISSRKINMPSHELLFKQSWHPVSPAAHNVSSLKIPEEFTLSSPGFMVLVH